MLDLGPHAGFIWWAYGIVTVVLGGLIFWLIADENRQRRLLSDLEKQGITRRSANKNDVESVAEIDR